ncbi:hypothetical protein SASPL_114738 [Salvia splendens]|uniref:peptidylprolyl isomerase n=1 Tax=Salvia splendens TaxID=180675 RepID=A0A8X8Y6M9_SALSN|nr:hypothetical protein SASPL_114738 [Salvia splendens]
MALIAVGVAGNNVSLKPFLQEQEEREGGPNLFVKLAGAVLVVVVALTGAIALPYIKPWTLRFGIPAICTVLATALFLTGLCFYRYTRIGADGSRLRSLCRVRMIPMLTTFVFCGLVSSIGNTYFVEQAKNLNRHLGKWNVTLQVLLLVQKGVSAVLDQGKGDAPAAALGGAQTGRYQTNVQSRVITTPGIGVVIAVSSAILCCITAAKMEFKRLGVMTAAAPANLHHDPSRSSLPVVVAIPPPPATISLSCDSNFGYDSIELIAVDNDEAVKPSPNTTIDRLPSCDQVGVEGVFQMSSTLTPLAVTDVLILPPPPPSAAIFLPCSSDRIHTLSIIPAAAAPLQVHECDRVDIHYKGKLIDGIIFDPTFERGDPIDIKLGSGQVIKRWLIVLGMCLEFPNDENENEGRYADNLAKGVSGLGYMCGVLSVYVVGEVSGRGGHRSWFQDTLNTSRLDRYYWVLAALGIPVKQKSEEAEFRKER